MALKSYEGYLENGLFRPLGADMAQWGKVKAILTLLEEPLQKPRLSHEEWVAEMERLREEARDEVLPEDFLEKREPMKVYEFSDD